MRNVCGWLVGTALLVVASSAWAQTGVSDDRVNLPEGPGSLDGIGDNSSVDPNMGMLRYSFPVAVPRAWNGTTPSLSFAYSSAAGSSSLGIGWSMDLPFVERATLFELPEYDEADDFALNGSEMLVRVADGDPATYRARREGSFVRYLWHDADGGADGYWEAQNPDGTVSYFGADANGNTVSTARITGPSGTFRYLLVETVDPYGHSVRYDYSELGTTLLPARVRYGFIDGVPLYEVRFTYETRPDPLSDCRPGFNERMDHRLTRVDILAEGETIRSYAVTYEDAADSGGFSRVRRIVTFGRDGGQYPIDLEFSYSQALGGLCEAGACAEPFLTTMPSLGVDVSSGTGTLVDLNGDALPDFVDSAGSGAHRIFFNRLVEQPDGTFRNTFDAPVDSATGTGSAFGLASPYVQVLDVDGDGFADLLHAQRAEVLPNDAEGDWGAIESLAPSATEDLPDFGEGFEIGSDELATIRFFDFDNDRRIDILRSEGTTLTEIFRNNGTAGFTPVEGVGVIGAGFDGGLDLADMNGDGLLDPVRVRAGEITWKLNLGRGRWSSSWITGENAPSLTETELQQVELDDLNGDALDDLVLVQGNEVQFWLNRGGVRFDDGRTIDDAVVSGIPERTSSTTVLFADMNGNGSSDVVWISASGAVTYLELFPQRPNLLTRIENGIGLVLDVTYGTSVEHMTRDGGAESWPNRLPYPMNVVDRMDAWDRLNEAHDVIEYAYHDGFYDGIEKQFRGYARVEVLGEGDAFEETSLSRRVYDVGDEDPYRAGLSLSSATFAVVDGDEQPMAASSIEYDECDLTGVPTSGLRFPVRFVCPVATVETLQERLDPSAWVQTRIEMDYDGYGNVVAQRDLGVVSVGGGACGPCTRDDGDFGAPCGADCAGDEMYTWSTYVSPENTGGRWITGSVATQRSSARADRNEYAEVRTYYDGEDFVGLALGRLTEGRITRVEERVSTTDEFVATERYGHDEHGNVVETWGPRAAADNRIERRVYSYEDGLFLTSAEVLLTDHAGAPITLRNELTFDRAWGEPSSMSGWHTVGEEADAASRATRWVRDEFGRPIETYRAGDPEGKPSTAFEYDLGPTVSRIISRHRSVLGAAEPDVEQIMCHDGFGRVFQYRERIDANSYHVSSHRRIGRGGEELELWDPWRGEGDACELAPPAGWEPTTMRYDAAGRLVTMREPDGDGGFTEQRTEYEPLRTLVYDAGDMDPESPYFDTPSVVEVDGLGRTVARVRDGGGGRLLRTSFAYDVYGNPASATDPEGVTIRQSATPDGRIVRLDDPHRGERLFEHDLSGNIVREEDARGAVVRYEFDGANRRVAEWDDDDRDATLKRWFYDRAPGCAATDCANAAGYLAGTSFVLDGATVTELMGYDRRQQPAFVRRDLNGHRYEFRNRYDNYGRLESEELPGGIELTFERDAFGRLTSVPGVIDAIEYDERGQPERVELANGVTTEYVHDGQMRLVSITSTNATGAVLLAHTYTRDTVGNVLAIEDGRASDGIPSASAEYEYDALYRLITAELDAGREGFAETLSWEWSDGGNLLSRTSSLGANSAQHVEDIVYGGGGAGPYAVTTFGDLALEYDPVGHTTRRGDLTYEWDAFGRMSTARRAETQLVGEYGYDAFDERAYKREGGRETFYFSDRYEVRDGVATVYVDIDTIRLARVESAALAAEVLSDLAPATGTTSSATPEPDAVISAGDAWVAQGVSTGAITLTSGVGDDPRRLLASSAHRLLLGDDLEATSFFHQNHQGTVLATSDETGAVVERNEFYPEGGLRWANGGSPESFGFSGKEHDASGLIFFGARYLDPVLGRWTSPDPTFLHVDATFMGYGEEATNPYGYALGNPVNNRDPDGRFVDNIVGGIVGALGGAIITGVSDYIQQRNEIKSGSRQKISWKQLAIKAGISAAIGGAVGATGIGGWAAFALGAGIKAGSAALVTTLKWRGEVNLKAARSTNDPVEQRRLEKRARWWHRSAYAANAATVIVGLGMGAADAASSAALSTALGDAGVTVLAAAVAVDAITGAVDTAVDVVSAERGIVSRRASTQVESPATPQVSGSNPTASTSGSDSDAGRQRGTRVRSRSAVHRSQMRTRPRANSTTTRIPAGRRPRAATR